MREGLLLPRSALRCVSRSEGELEPKSRLPSWHLAELRRGLGRERVPELLHRQVPGLERPDLLHRLPSRQVQRRARLEGRERLQGLPLRLLLPDRLLVAYGVPGRHVYAELAHAGERELPAVPRRIRVPQRLVRPGGLRLVPRWKVGEHDRLVGGRGDADRLQRRRLGRALQPRERRLRGLPPELLLPRRQRGADILPTRNDFTGGYRRRSGLHRLPGRISLPAAR
mmetsp:Transcript_80201/g.217272  ORF Transcript_80201/g.217272 Transcript_80201/m.217272 type:complete len:226 (+) Transcript_80201:293-970(+)